MPIEVGDTPVVTCGGAAVLRNPGHDPIAGCLGFNEALDATQIRDAVIVGTVPRDSPCDCCPDRRIAACSRAVAVVR